MVARELANGGQPPVAMGIVGRREDQQDILRRFGEDRGQDFGMEAVRQKEEQPKSIVSTVAGDFDGWGPGSQIRLANGQVWRIIDGSEAVLPRMKNPKVSIERNVFGTLFLKVEGSNNSAKVRRVQ